MFSRFRRLAGSPDIRRCEGAVVKVRKRPALNPGPENSVDGVGHAEIFRGDQGEGIAGAGGPTGPPDAVDVIFGCGRDVVVDDVGDLRNINAPGGDVGGHQNLELPVAESVEGGLTLSLGEVSLDRCRTIAGPGQLFADAFGPVFGPGEHEHRVGIGMAQQLQEQLRFQVRGDRVEGMTDRLSRRGNADLDGGRVPQYFICQMPDLVGHGGGKEQGLTVLGDLPDDPPDVREKAHIEHTVRLVQDQDLQFGEVDRSLPEVVQKPAGAGYDDLDSALQFLFLGIDAHASIDGSAPQAGFSPQHLDGLVNLLSQFPGGGDDQRADVPALSFHEPIQDGQCKGGSLAGTRLGEAHDVAAFHNEGNRIRLDGGRAGKTRCRDAVCDGGVKRKILKCHSVLLSIEPIKKAPETFRGLR